jgi:hypothetical protein
MTPSRHSELAPDRPRGNELVQILSYRRAPGESVDAILRRCFTACDQSAPTSHKEQGATSETRDQPKDGAFGSRLPDVDAGCNHSLTAMEALIFDLRRLAEPSAEALGVSETLCIRTGSCGFPIWSRIEAILEHDSVLVAGGKPLPGIPAAFLEVSNGRVD